MTTGWRGTGSAGIRQCPEKDEAAATSSDKSEPDQGMPKSQLSGSKTEPIPGRKKIKSQGPRIRILGKMRRF